MTKKTRKGKHKVIICREDKVGSAIEAGVIDDPKAVGAPAEDWCFLRFKTRGKVQTTIYMRKDEVLDIAWVMQTLFCALIDVVRV